MIRQANKYDKTQIIDFMKCFRDESPLKEIFASNDETQLSNLINNILAGQGRIFIKDKVGFFMCLILPSIWNHETFVLHEIAWYVLPEYRNGTSGYKLLKAYLEYANELKNSGRIKYFTLSKIANSPNLKYEKLGFRKIDENWIQ
jgi:N-acetylglutamate synthase-like GNAT family acetyltransferase